jgi:signal transduction histidine kinase
MSYLSIILFTAVITMLLLTLVLRVDTLFALLVVGILLAGGLFALVPEYLVKRRYYRELRELLAQLDKKYLLAAVIEYPDFTEGKLWHDALKAMGKSMNDEIARFSSASQEYREYIEMWVHEIKTPIAGMKLMSENIRNRELFAELDRIDFLVEQVLFYARSNTVERDYQIRQVSLDEVVGAALKRRARQLIARGIRVDTQGLSLTVLTDTKWTLFILCQFIDNSIKYGTSTLAFSAVRREGGVALSVRDDGVGIEEKDIDHIFEKGFTGENGRRFGKATGLGLYLCRKLCVKLGLTIGAQSMPGEGTTLEIFFPQRDPFS